MREEVIKKLKKIIEEIKIRRSFLERNNMDEGEIERLNEEETKCETILRFMENNNNEIVDKIEGYKKYFTIANFIGWGEYEVVLRFIGMRNIENVLGYIHCVILSCEDETYYYIYFKTSAGDIYLKI